MPNLEMVRPIPAALRNEGMLWLPEVNVRLWRASYGAFTTSHKVFNLSSASPTVGVGWTLLDTVYAQFSDDAAADAGLASLKMQVGIFYTVTAGALQNDFAMSVRMTGSGTPGSLSVQGQDPDVNAYLTHEWTTFPTGIETLTIEYQLTASINNPGDEEGTVTPSTQADAYIAVLEA